MEFFGLDLAQTTGDSVYDQNDIMNAFSDDIILEEPTTVSTESVKLIDCQLQQKSVNLVDAARMAAEAAAASSFAAIACSVQVPKMPEPFLDVPIKKVQKVQKAFKAPCGRTSKGTLKRKVIGDGDNFVSDISKTRRLMEFRKREEYERFGGSSQKQQNRNLKTRGNDTYVLGHNVHPSHVPSSASRRMCQVIGAMGNWDRYGVFFTKVPDIIKALKFTCEQEMKENGFCNQQNSESFLRATIQRSLCTEGKRNDYIFTCISRYILQEKYTNTDSMSYKTIQSLCGSICKYNTRIEKEFPDISYSKAGSSRVSNTLFNVMK